MLEVRALFHGINLKRKTYFNPILEGSDLNFLEVEILVFLHEQPNQNTFTQIIQSKDYAKSHISTAIHHLVDGGYLLREVASTNKKIQHLHLLEKSEGIIEGYYQCAQAFRAQALAHIPESDLQTFYQVVEKINQNLRDN